MFCWFQAKKKTVFSLFFHATSEIVGISVCIVWIWIFFSVLPKTNIAIRQYHILYEIGTLRIRCRWTFRIAIIQCCKWLFRDFFFVSCSLLFCSAFFCCYSANVVVRFSSSSFFCCLVK